MGIDTERFRQPNWTPSQTDQLDRDCQRSAFKTVGQLNLRDFAETNEMATARQASHL
jgi:hypothetical protein